MIPVRKKVALLALLRELDMLCHTRYLLMILTRQSFAPIYSLLLVPPEPIFVVIFTNGEYNPSAPPLSDDKITLPDLDSDTCVEIIKSTNDFRLDKTMMVIVLGNMIG